MVDRQHHAWRLSKIQEELENVEFPPPPPPLNAPSEVPSLEEEAEVAPPQFGPHGGSLRRRTDPTYRSESQQPHPSLGTNVTHEQQLQQQLLQQQQFQNEQLQLQHLKQQQLQQQQLQQQQLQQQQLQQQQLQQQQQQHNLKQLQLQSLTQQHLQQHNLNQEQLRLKEQQFQAQLQSQGHDQGQSQIYDKADINRKFSVPETDAIRRITEKYDSLGRNGMGLLKAYAEQQQQQQQQHQRSRSCDSILDSVESSGGEEFRGTVNRDLLVAGGYRRVLETDSSLPASVGVDPSFPPPPTQDELTNASGIVARSSAVITRSSTIPRRAAPSLPVSTPGLLGGVKASLPVNNQPTSVSNQCFSNTLPLTKHSLPGSASEHAVSNTILPGNNPPHPLSVPVPAPSSLLLAQHETGGGALTEAEILQVEMFYRSHRSQVWVCGSTAHLHLGSIKITTSLTPKGGSLSGVTDKRHKHSSASSASSAHAQRPLVGGEMVENWKYIRMGVPVFLIDSGSTSAGSSSNRKDRKLYILLAEKGTGFTLWRDQMDHLSAYKPATSVFHTMHLSGDHHNMAGFAFDDAHAAGEFLARWKAISGNPDDDILNLSGKSGKKRKKEEKKPKFKAPSKSAISTPCCFTHVTKLDRSDGLNILGTKGRDPKQLASPVKTSRVSSLVPSEAHSS